MKTLDELKKKTESKGEDFAKRKFLTLKDKDAVRIRFRQELTEDSKNYDAERGTALVTGVHTNPLNFKIRAGCTAESEEHGFQCWACEQFMENPKDNGKWRPQQRFFINVAVQKEDGTWEAAVFEQGFGKSHIGNDLVENAIEFGSIVDRTYKLSRKGSGFNDTEYSLLPLAESDEPEEVKALELYNFDGLAKTYPYNEQQEHFFPTEEKDPAKKW